MRLVASFTDPERLVAAVERVRQRGWEVADVFAPLPVHGLDEAMGLKPSRLGVVTFAGGFAGMVGAILLQVYCAVVDWPLEVGGKPPNSALAFLPITFELTVLVAGLATAAAFLAKSRLWPRLAAPRLPARGVTDDRFALVLAPPFDEAEARALFAAAGAIEVRWDRRRRGAPVAAAVSVALAAALAAGGCRAEAGAHGIEYMPDMARPVPYEAFSENPVTRDGLTLQAPVAGTVARGAHPLHYGPGPEEAERAGRELAEPFAATPEALARGQRVYATFCAVCHGEAGAGDGPVTAKFPHPPAYSSERLMAMPAGQIFHVVTYGTALMPAYAAQIPPDDRWKAVLYVEHLQHREER